MATKHHLLLALSRGLDLPSDVMTGEPDVEIRGRNEVTVLRHRGIVGYDAQCVRIGTEQGVLRVCGTGLQIHRMNRERIVLYGEISGIMLQEAEE